jgi:ABC-type branched-subunit amino acid transport system substrate-binding protein
MFRDTDHTRPSARRGRRYGRRRASSAAVAVAVALALIAGACGSNGRSGAGAEGATTKVAPAAGGFGTLASPCGPGQPSGSPDLGVTDTSVTIGYGDDAGYAGLAGQGHEMSDAVKALISWCNEQGGINGRKVVGNYYDAKVTEVTNAMTAACEANNFFMVGEGFVFDTAQEQVRMGCGLPAVPAYGTSAAFSNGRLVYMPEPVPIDYDQVTLARWYAQTHPDKAKKVASISANIAASTDTLDKQKATWPAVGVEFLPCDQQYNLLGEADWKPFVQRLKDCGAEAVTFIGTANPSLENLLEAANQLDYHPDWLQEGNFYDAPFAAWNTNGWADNVYVQYSNVPFEHASDSPAMQQYVSVVKGAGGDISGLGVNAASAFLLWATAAQSCGNALTRQCALDALAQEHAWDGGGMSGPADVGANMPSQCAVVLQLAGTSFTQVAPDTGGSFDCDAANVQKVNGSPADKANLGPDRRIPAG